MSKYPIDPPLLKTGNINKPKIIYIVKAIKTTFLLNKRVSKIIVGICHVIGMSKLILDLSVNGSGI